MRRIIMASITAVVVIAVLAGTLIPVLDDATATTETFTNEGYYDMDLITSSSEKTIKWEVATPDIIEIDGTDFDMSSFATTNMSYTIIGSDTLIVRYTPLSGYSMIQAFDSDNSYASYLSTDTMTYLTITISNGTVTFTSDKSGSESFEFSIGDECYAISTDGDYAVMKQSSEPAYVLGDSAIRLIGISYGTSKNSAIGVYGYGTLDDGMTISTLYLGSNHTAVTYGDVTTTSSEVDGYEDLYSLDKFVFTADIDGTETTFTYSYFIVPAEVTAEKSVHFTDGQNAILNAIPVIVIVALLLGVVAIVLRSRMD